MILKHTFNNGTHYETLLVVIALNMLRCRQYFPLKNAINLICELDNGGGDLRPIGLSLRPDIRLSHCWCGHDITGLPAQRRDGRDSTGFSV